MTQYQAGVLTEGQAINIIHTAIGVSKEDARKLLQGTIDEVEDGQQGLLEAA